MLLDTLDGCRARVRGSSASSARPTTTCELLAELAGPGAPVVVQEGEGLGDALATGVRYALGRGGAALLVSSDIPGIPAGRARRRRSRCSGEGADVVLGPGYDGGYWLHRRCASDHPGAVRRHPLVDRRCARGDPRPLPCALARRAAARAAGATSTRADDLAALADRDRETLPGTRTRSRPSPTPLAHTSSAAHSNHPGGIRTMSVNASHCTADRASRPDRRRSPPTRQTSTARRASRPEASTRSGRPGLLGLGVAERFGGPGGSATRRRPRRSSRSPAPAARPG